MIGKKIVLVCVSLLIFIPLIAKADVITFGCSSAVSCTLKELENGGHMVIDGLLFDDWFASGIISPDQVTIGAIQQGANVIGLDVRPTDPANNPFRLLCNAPNVSHCETGQTVSSDIFFNATPTTGVSIDGTIISGTFLQRGGAVTEGIVLGGPEDPVFSKFQTTCLGCSELTNTTLIAGGDYPPIATSNFFDIASQITIIDPIPVNLGDFQITDMQEIFLLSPITLSSIPSNNVAILSNGQVLVFPLPTIPEPSSVALLTAGLIGLGFLCRRSFRDISAVRAPLHKS